MSTAPDAAALTSAERSNGLATYLKVIFAPSDAFATLARIPTWGWAAVIGMILILIATYIQMPATMHFTHIAQEQRLAQMPADQAAAARQAMAKFPVVLYAVFGMVGSLFGAWIFWLIAAVVFIIGASLSGAEARFGGAWVAAVNLYLIAVLGQVLNAIIVSLRGAASISSASDLFGVPSLAMLVQGTPKLAAFLYGFNIINIWYYIVAVIALERVLKMSRGAAIATVVIFALITAGLTTLFVR